ncbi:hypothetical protein FRC09_016777, partial [Ceratobasidium sp. 395]
MILLQGRSFVSSSDYPTDPAHSRSAKDYLATRDEAKPNTCPGCARSPQVLHSSGTGTAALRRFLPGTRPTIPSSLVGLIRSDSERTSASAGAPCPDVAPECEMEEGAVTGPADEGVTGPNDDVAVRGAEEAVVASVVDDELV